jgi:hypothetical protein
LDDKKEFLLQYPDAFHAFQDIMQQSFCSLYQGKMAEVGVGKPDGGNEYGDSCKYPEQTEIFVETFQQFRVPGKEFIEKGDIEHKNKTGKETHRKGIGHTVYQKRPDQFGERDFLILCNNAATPYFAYAGKYVIDRIIAQHGIDYIDHLKPFSYRIDKQAPAKASHDIGEQAENQRQKKDVITDTFFYDQPDCAKVHLAIQEPEQQKAQKKRKKYFYSSA